VAVDRLAGGNDGVADDVEEAVRELDDFFC
jgi:hypothetical protein